VPWSELITALTSLTAAFGVVILSGRREERNQLGAVRRAAYATLVTAVNAAIEAPGPAAAGLRRGAGR
jgi:hypothetical protein